MTTVLSPIGPVGDAERTILLDALAIMLAIVVPTIAATLAVCLAVPRDQHPRDATCPTGTTPAELELLVWSMPALVMLFLGGIIWMGSHDLDPAKPLTWAACQAVNRWK